MTDILIPIRFRYEKSWRGTPPATGALPIHRLHSAPPFLSGEAPSSWIYRIGVKYFVSPDVVTRLLYGGHKFAALDFQYRYRRFDQAAFLTMSDALRLRRQLLAGADLLVTERYDSIYLTQHQDGAPIYRYCPRCLKEDAIPHFRLAWRLAPVVLCERHEVALVERCPACLDRINLSRTRRHRVPPHLRRWVLRYCPTCNSLLTDVKPSPPPAPLSSVLLNFQRRFFYLLARMRGAKHSNGIQIWTMFCAAFMFTIRVPRRTGQLSLPQPRIDWRAVMAPAHFDLFIEWLGGQLDLTFRPSTSETGGVR